MARNNSSWLDAVKKAFTKHMSYTPKMIKPNQVHHQMQQKRSKRRWIFKKSGLVETTTTILHHESSDIIPETHYHDYSTTKSDDDAVAMAMAMAMATTEDQEDAAALVIQTLFRGYLARRALEALKGVVKLQALVRGHIVRKRAKMTLKCMQALLRVQARLCDQRSRNQISNQPNSIHNHTRKRSEEWCRMEEIQAMLQKTHLHHQEFEQESRRCYHPCVENHDTSPRKEETYNYYQQQRNNVSSSLSSSPLQSLPSSSHLLKVKSGSPRGKRSYMSPTESAMARTTSPTRQRKPTSCARKRLCFNDQKPHGTTQNMIDQDMMERICSSCSYNERNEAFNDE